MNTLSANTNGMIKVNGYPYQRGDLNALPAGPDDYSRFTVSTKDGAILFSAPLEEVGDEDGTAFASETALQTFVEDNFFFRLGGGGDLDFSASDGITWNGFQDYTLAANKDFIIGEKTSGLLLLTNSGSFTFKVYGVAITIRNSGTNGGRTTLSYVLHSNGKLWVESDADNLPKEVTLPAVDVTPPTVTSVEAIDANTIDVTISEAFSGTLGFSFNNGAGLTVASRTAMGGNVLRHVISETMLSTDSITWDYTPGNIADTATVPNAMIADSDAVTNSITAGAVYDPLTLVGTNTLVESPVGKWTSTAPNNIITNKKIASGTSGRFIIEWPATGGGVQMVGISPNNTATGNASFTYGFYSNTVTIVAIQTQIDTTHVPVTGNLYCVHVSDNGNGTCILTVEVSANHGSSWTVLNTLDDGLGNPNIPVSDWYGKFCSPSGWSGVFLNPQSENAV